MIYGAAWHEAGHAVAAYLLGLRIERIWIASPAELEAIEPAGASGHVELEQRPIVDLGDALNHMLVYLAGEAAVRGAWALGLLDEIEFGFTEPAPEPETLAEQVDELLARRGGSPTAATASYGYLSPAAESDLAAVREISAEWAFSSLEAASMQNLAEHRVAEWVGQPRFQALLGTLGPALLKGSMSGELADHLLGRADEIHGAEAREGV
jgi:hypothetical protein